MEMLRKLLGRREKSTPFVSEKEITAFFSSIENYVGISEQISLPLLNELMTAYFRESEEAIAAEQGTLEKFVGDVMVACFGSSGNRQDHAFRACTAALALQKRIAGLRIIFNRDETKWPEVVRRLRVRIGLHSGFAIVGNAGSAAGSGITMMGDNVNLAARLEKGAKSCGAEIVCTGQTKAGCDLVDANHILFRSLGKIVVKGRMDLIQLYEPLAFRSGATNEQLECIGLFELGLARYRAMDWDGAAGYFMKSAKLESLHSGNARNPSSVYLEWVERARLSPPHPAFLA